MLLRLLFTALVSGIHSGNVTNSSGWEGSFISVTKPNGTVGELVHLEAEVGLPPDPKLNLTTEDDESFQDQDQDQVQHYQHCSWEQLEQHSFSFCGLEFQKSMEALGPQHWCSFHKVIGPYNSLTFCMERLCALLGCFYPNPTVQELFLQTHTRFFLTCSQDERLLTDAPHAVVMALTLVPVAVIPLLVYLVVWKSNGWD